jgi:hypothetical protein
MTELKEGLPLWSPLLFSSFKNRLDSNSGVFLEKGARPNFSVKAQVVACGNDRAIYVAACTKGQQPTRSLGSGSV